MILKVRLAGCCGLCVRWDFETMVDRDLCVEDSEAKGGVKSWVYRCLGCRCAE